MKQTIEIEVPDGKKAIWKDNKIVFEDIKPPLPKTWEEFCKQNNINKNKGEAFIHTSGEIETIKKVNAQRIVDYDKNVLPSKQAAEQHLALMQLHQLRDCYRQGWIPNWENRSKKYGIERIYNLIDDKTELRICEYSNTSLFLTFPTCEIAEEFLNNFKDLIEQAGDLI